MKHKNAKTLLRALTEIDDKYIEEAERFRKAKIRKLPSAAQITGLAVACLVLVIGAPLYLRRQAETGQSGAVMQTGNPWQEVASVAEAEALTGFGLVLPEPESPYTREVIRVLNREVISVAYMREDSGEIGYELRKEKGETDPSGDFTEYAETTEKRVDGINVTLRGENGRRFLATWTRDGYSYSVEAQANPMTEEELSELVKNVR
ncbi:MAG: DUF4367 domain-containing protein [Stomatobaculum longum]